MHEMTSLIAVNFLILNESLGVSSGKTSDIFNIFKDQIVLQYMPPSTIYLHLSPTNQPKLTNDYLSFNSIHHKN